MKILKASLERLQSYYYSNNHLHKLIFIKLPFFLHFFANIQEFDENALILRYSYDFTQQKNSWILKIICLHCLKNHFTFHALVLSHFLLLSATPPIHSFKLIGIRGKSTQINSFSS